MKRDPNRASVRRRILVDRLALGILVAVGLVGVLTGVAAGPEMAVPVAGAGVATLAIGRVGVRQRRRLGFLGRQLAWTAGAAVSVGLLTTWALAAMRADESPDVLVVAALLTAVALGVVYGTYVADRARRRAHRDVRALHAPHHGAGIGLKRLFHGVAGWRRPPRGAGRSGPLRTTAVP